MFVPKYKHAVKFLLIIVNLAIILMASLRSIVASRPFMNGPDQESQYAYSAGDYQHILTILHKDNPRNFKPCTFTIASYLKEFIGYKSHRLWIGVRRDKDGYTAIINRVDDVKDFWVAEYKIDHNFNIISKSKSTCIYD